MKARESERAVEEKHRKEEEQLQAQKEVSERGKLPKKVGDRIAAREAAQKRIAAAKARAEAKRTESNGSLTDPLPKSVVGAGDSVGGISDMSGAGAGDSVADSAGKLGAGDSVAASEGAAAEIVARNNNNGSEPSSSEDSSEAEEDEDSPQREYDENAMANAMAVGMGSYDVTPKTNRNLSKQDVDVEKGGMTEVDVFADEKEADSVDEVGHVSVASEEEIPSRAQSVPWWKQRRNVIGLLLCLIMVIILAVVLGVTLGGGSEEKELAPAVDRVVVPDTSGPSEMPSTVPTSMPTITPAPSLATSENPSVAPSLQPSLLPTAEPTDSPSASLFPSVPPTLKPTLVSQMHLVDLSCGPCCFLFEARL